MFTQENNTQWFNQTLMTYKDNVYATDGYLRLSIVTNTTDYKNFNPPELNLSIKNNFTKNLMLNIQEARDLLKAFKNILASLNGHELNIQRKFQKNTLLHFTFKLDPNNIRIVIIEIRNNETDFVKIAIPLENVFESFASCIREFTEQYMYLCSNLLIQGINSQSSLIIQQLPSLIKGISSQILSNDSFNTNNILLENNSSYNEEQVEDIVEENLIQTEMTIADLDKFLGNNMENVEIKELDDIDKKEDKIQEVENIFTKNILKNDLYNLETMLSNTFTSNNPFVTTFEDIKSKLSPYISDENYTIYPGISEDEIKSFSYITKMLNSLNYKNYLLNKIPLPASMPILQYDVKSYTDDNLDIAYDLFIHSMYIRTVRRRLESKTSDAISSKALFHIQLRSLIDPLVFSFLGKVDPSLILSTCMTRYKYYDKIGVFDNYKNLLKEYNCPEITESEMSNNFDIFNNFKPQYINDVHNVIVNNNSYRVKFKNQYNLEQIINEIVPLEIEEKMGADLNNSETMNKLIKQHNVSGEVLQLFMPDKKVKIKPKTAEKYKNNLHRAVYSLYLDEVPERFRNDFVNDISELNENKFDFENTKYPLEEFGDKIIKALYVWNPSNESHVKNYKSFYEQVENEMLTRENILIVKKIESEKTKTDSSWDIMNY